MASMYYRELVALFRKNGIEFVKAAKGDHEIWFSPITKRKLTVPESAIRIDATPTGPPR